MYSPSSRWAVPDLSTCPCSRREGGVIHVDHQHAQRHIVVVERRPAHPVLVGIGPVTRPPRTKGERGGRGCGPRLRRSPSACL